MNEKQKQSLYKEIDKATLESNPMDAIWRLSEALKTIIESL